MDVQSLVQYKKIKRRERAARMATEAITEPAGLLDDLDSAEDDTDLLKLKPPRPPRPKKVKETLKDPLYEEDIVEGFSFCSFNTYEDLEVRCILFYLFRIHVWQIMSNNFINEIQVFEVMSFEKTFASM